MSLPLFPTAYLPSVLYLAVMASYEAVAIEQWETFPKQTFRNRAVIATAGGNMMLNVPVIRTQGNHTRTDQMVISYQEPWNIRHWRAIVSAYSAAPYFLYYRDGIEEILMQRHDRLIDLNDALLRHLLKKMKIECQINYTADYEPCSPAAEEAGDYRSILADKHCPLLEKHSPLPAYPQVFDTRYGFQPNLTVLDLLFNLGPEAKDYLFRLK